MYSGGELVRTYQGAQRRRGGEAVSLPHKTRPVQVWVDADLGIADLVVYLNTIPGVRTDASCQGTIGEGGPNPYRAQVMCHWTNEAWPRLREEFDITPLGMNWGYVHPRNPEDEAKHEHND
jgi:hypothetical protein